MLGIEKKGSLADDFVLQNTLRDVAILLGVYNLNVELVDNGPSPAQFRDGLRPVVSKTDKLLAHLRSLDERTRGLLDAWLTESGAPCLAEIERNLDVLYGAASQAVNSLQTYAGPGRRTQFALRELIGRLRDVFGREYRGSANTQRVRAGSVESLSEREYDERDFVTIALDAAGIPYPADLAPFFAKPVTLEPAASGKPDRPAGKKERRKGEFVRREVPPSS